MSGANFREPLTQRIGPYEVLLEIGSGGMGTISLARATGEPVGVGGFTRLVALKRPHGGLASDPEVMGRFLDEARLLAQVHHANVIGIHQIGSDGVGHFLVLDYVEGGTLDELMSHAVLRRMRLPPPLVMRIVSDVLAGLHAVHEAADAEGHPLRMLHRDVSTHNVLVGKDGVARLADFGIAKAITSSTVTDKAYLQGRVPYMAPEYLRREVVDRRLDVYAMGVTMWTALSGDLPWPDASEAQIVHSAVHEGIPPLAAAGVTVAPAIQEILSRACERDVARRYATAGEMLDAIEELGRHTGWIASHAEVAEMVDGLLGRELTARRAALAGRLSSPDLRVSSGAAGLRAPELPPLGASSSGPLVVSSSTPLEAPSSASRGRTGMAIAALLLVAGVSATLAWQWRGSRSAEAASTAASTAPVTLAASTVVTVTAVTAPAPVSATAALPTTSAVAVPPAVSVRPAGSLTGRLPSTAQRGPAALPTGITTTNPYR